jgi:uncharacterized protein YlxW (UPF0749 family)
MIELIFRVGFCSLLFAFIVAILIVCALSHEAKKQKRENKSLKRQISVMSETNKRSQAQIDDLLEERKLLIIKINMLGDKKK